MGCFLSKRFLQTLGSLSPGHGGVWQQLAALVACSCMCVPKIAPTSLAGPSMSKIFDLILCLSLVTAPSSTDASLPIGRRKWLLSARPVLWHLWLLQKPRADESVLTAHCAVCSGHSLTSEDRGFPQILTSWRRPKCHGLTLTQSPIPCTCWHSLAEP